MQYSIISLWLDDPIVGCGVRTYVVLSLGRKLAKLYNPPACRVVTVPLEELRRSRALDLTPGGLRRLRARIKQSLAEKQRFGIRVSAAACREAVALVSERIDKCGPQMRGSSTTSRTR